MALIFLLVFFAALAVAGIVGAVADSRDSEFELGRVLTRRSAPGREAR